MSGKKCNDDRYVEAKVVCTEQLKLKKLCQVDSLSSNDEILIRQPCLLHGDVDCTCCQQLPKVRGASLEDLCCYFREHPCEEREECEAGPQGFQGRNGVQGFQGIQGTPGDNGHSGQQGCCGPQGNIGKSGLDGLDGEDGPQGKRGPCGKDGQDGHDGEQGPQGPQGKDGVRGSQGERGEPGQDGEDGPPGPQGPCCRGPQGAPGREGPQGPQGLQGDQGREGGIGDQGFQGPQGTQGPTNCDCAQIFNGLFPLEEGEFPQAECCYILKQQCNVVHFRFHLQVEDVGLQGGSYVLGNITGVTFPFAAGGDLCSTLPNAVTVVTNGLIGLPIGTVIVRVDGTVVLHLFDPLSGSLDLSASFTWISGDPCSCC